MLAFTDPSLCEYWSSYAAALTKCLGIETKKTKYLSDGELQLLHFQAQVLEKATAILQSCEDEEAKQVGYIPYHTKTRNETKEGKQLRVRVKAVIKRIMERTLIIAPQMMQEVSCELQRLMILPPYWKFQERASCHMSNPAVLKIKAVLEKLMDPTVIFDEKLEKSVRRVLKESESICGGLGISDEERVMIVRAMGLRQGHWYKCPNGHVYCIGECGGAMQESKCPHCGAKIGGRSHTLTDGNTVASEMDGAQFAAWSEGNNLGNFDLANL